MKRRLGAWLVLLAAAFYVTGCGTGDDEHAAPAVDVTGTWVGVTDLGSPIKMTLKQLGNDVQGTTVDGVIIGFVTTNEFDATLVYTNGPAATIEATVEGKIMSGIYAIKGGHDGPFSAIRK